MLKDNTLDLILKTILFPFLLKKLKKHECNSALMSPMRGITMSY